MARSPDTEPWADEMQIELLRQAGPARRLELACQLSALAWNAARSAFDRLYPHETQDQRDLRFLSSIYGEQLARDFIAYRQKVRGPQNERLAP
ncbi:MAG: hypothetical protein NTW87_02075 [Planctomycetota bacterium]|nr:hypothetical protein [Planctomycetota bacterium]